MKQRGIKREGLSNRLPESGPSSSQWEKTPGRRQLDEGGEPEVEGKKIKNWTKQTTGGKKGGTRVISSLTRVPR